MERYTFAVRFAPDHAILFGWKKRAARALARTVDAAVHGAGAARLLYLFAQRAAGAKHANPCVAARDADIFCIFLYRYVVDFDALERLGVLGLQRLGELRYAFADRAMRLGSVLFVLEFGRELRERFRRGPWTPVALRSTGGICGQALRKNLHSRAVDNRFVQLFDLLVGHSNTTIGPAVSHVGCEKREAACCAVDSDGAPDAR
jgi:hypothetical protein